MSWNNGTAGGNPTFDGGVPDQFNQFDGGNAGGMATGGFDSGGFDNGGFAGNGDAGASDDRACFNCGKPG